MTNRKAIYPASLDPITNGHVNVIERIAPLYDELVVVVAVDARKNYLFTPEERASIAREAVAHLPHVTVEVCAGQYVVTYAATIGAQVMIRGLRNLKDLEDEQTLTEENRHIAPHVETLWVPCLPHLMHVSSSMVKGHMGIGPDWSEHVARSVPVLVVAKLKEKHILCRARTHWLSLMSALGNPVHADQVFQKLTQCYSEPHRKYHTLKHIVAILDELEYVASSVANIEVVKTAIWYHDVVYETATKDHAKIAGNEARSAHKARLDIKTLELPESFNNRVSELIAATEHTKPVTDPDAQILVDLDLAILGQPAEEFDEYERSIRMEYQHVPEAIFRAKRSAILQAFLDRPFIYTTDFFRARYENAARENLKRLIEQLQR